MSVLGDPGSVGTDAAALVETPPVLELRGVSKTYGAGVGGAPVIALRDVEGFSGREVAAALGISAANERVLLHRARSSVRLELEEYLGR